LSVTSTMQSGFQADKGNWYEFKFDIGEDQLAMGAAAGFASWTSARYTSSNKAQAKFEQGMVENAGMMLYEMLYKGYGFGDALTGQDYSNMQYSMQDYLCDFAEEAARKQQQDRQRTQDMDNVEGLLGLAWLGLGGILGSAWDGVKDFFSDFDEKISNLFTEGEFNSDTALRIQKSIQEGNYMLAGSLEYYETKREQGIPLTTDEMMEYAVMRAILEKSKEEGGSIPTRLIGPGNIFDYVETIYSPEEGRDYDGDKARDVISTLAALNGMSYSEFIAKANGRDSDLILDVNYQDTVSIKASQLIVEHHRQKYNTVKNLTLSSLFEIGLNAIFGKGVLDRNGNVIISKLERLASGLNQQAMEEMRKIIQEEVVDNVDKITEPDVRNWIIENKEQAAQSMAAAMCNITTYWLFSNATGIKGVPDTLGKFYIQQANLGRTKETGKQYLPESGLYPFVYFSGSQSLEEEWHMKRIIFNDDTNGRTAIALQHLKNQSIAIGEAASGHFSIMYRGVDNNWYWMDHHNKNRRYRVDFESLRSARTYRDNGNRWYYEY